MKTGRPRKFDPPRPPQHAISFTVAESDYQRMRLMLLTHNIRVAEFFREAGLRAFAAAETRAQQAAESSP